MCGYRRLRADAMTFIFDDLQRVCVCMMLLANANLLDNRNKIVGNALFGLIKRGFSSKHRFIFLFLAAAAAAWQQSAKPRIALKSLSSLRAVHAARAIHVTKQRNLFRFYLHRRSSLCALRRFQWENML